MGFRQAHGAKPTTIDERRQVTLAQSFATAGLQHVGIGGCQEYLASGQCIGRLENTLHEVGQHKGQVHATQVVIKGRRGQTLLNKGFQAGFK